MPWAVRSRAYPPQPSSSAGSARLLRRRDKSDERMASSSAQNAGATNYASSSTDMRAPFLPSSDQHPRIPPPERILGCASAPATPRTSRLYHLPGPDPALPASLSSRPHERMPMPGTFAQARFDAIPVVDMEADRLARACGLSPSSIHWVEPLSSRVLGRDPSSSLDIDADGSTSSTDPAGPSGLNARPRARSVRVPQRTPASQGTPSRPRSASQPASIPTFSPSSPRPVLRSLRDILDQEGVQLDGCLDVQHVVERWRRAAASERGLEREAHPQALGAADLKTFGAPVGVAVKCGSMATAMGGFQHPIPWVVFACIEELNRTGIYQPGLFRSVPHRNHLSELIHNFDLPLPLPSPPALPQDEMMCPLVTPTLSTTRASLRKESMADICALLKAYLTELPEPLLDENLTVALYQYCVHPSVVRERLESESALGTGHDTTDGGYFAPQRTSTRPPPVSPLSFPTGLLTPSEQRTAALSAESAQIVIAQHLLRLAPPPLCSLFCYLFGFFTQLPLSPDNGMTLEDVSRMFGRVLADDTTVSRRHAVLMWLLERWARISEGLFDVAGSKDGDDVETETTPQPAFVLFSPPVPQPGSTFQLSTENIALAVPFFRPHSASVSSCQSDGAASVASASTGESVRTPGTEPTSLFAVTEAEPWEMDERWDSYASVRLVDRDVHIGQGADDGHASRPLLHKHGAASMYEVSPPESEYASCACSPSGSGSADPWDSHYHDHYHYHSQSQSGASSRSWPVSPRMKAGAGGSFSLPTDAFVSASGPGVGPWGLLCGGDSDVTPREHSR